MSADELVEGESYEDCEGDIRRINRFVGPQLHYTAISVRRHEQGKTFICSRAWFAEEHALMIAEPSAGGAA